jgi:predicted  nucleic acid-binding Zn-ribbon protein
MSKEQFNKYRTEVFAKTNYVNSLIDRISEIIKQSNEMAENNHKLIKTMGMIQTKTYDFYKQINQAGQEFNTFRSKISDLTKGTDFVSSKDLSALLGEYEGFQVDEESLVEELPTTSEVDYE